MRSYLRSLLKWFKILLRKFIGFHAQKPVKTTFPPKKSSKTEFNRPLSNYSFPLEEELPNEQANSQPTPFIDEISQQAPNYLLRPQRELLIDQSFESEQDQYSFLSDSEQEPQMGKTVDDSASVRREASYDQTNSQPSSSSMEGKSQNPPNYPAMPRRELLIDKPFEVKSEKFSLSDSGRENKLEISTSEFYSTVVNEQANLQVACFVEDEDSSQKLPDDYPSLLEHESLIDQPVEKEFIPPDLGQETKPEGFMDEFPTDLVREEPSTEQVDSQLFPSIDKSQEPQNYPSMPERELLVDKPFELESEQARDHSPDSRQENFATQITLQSLPTNAAQLTDKSWQKRPYLKYYTDQLEKLAESAWNNSTILSKIQHELQFRSKKRAKALLARVSKRLAELKNKERFVWPTATTTVGVGSKKLSGNVFKCEEGLLSFYGYKVGVNGLSESQRRRILDDIFLNPLPSMDKVSYSNEWGQIRTAKRLKKLASSIATFTRNAKRRSTADCRKAIQDWESDLAYLKRTYYNDRFDFQWPRTNASRS